MKIYIYQESLLQITVREALASKQHIESSLSPPPPPFESLRNHKQQYRVLRGLRRSSILPQLYRETPANDNNSSPAGIPRISILELLIDIN